MARKPRDVRDMTNEQVADIFINFDRNYTFAGVLETVYVAARQDQEGDRAFLNLKGDILAALNFRDGAEKAKQAIDAHTQQVVEFQTASRVRRELIAGVVHRYAFTSGPFGEGDDYDPTRERSRAVADILLRHAVEHNRKQDEIDEDLEEEVEK